MATVTAGRDQGAGVPAQQKIAHGPAPWADNNSTPRLIMRFGGGLNENTDPDIQECSTGYNFTLALNQQSFVPRPPFDLRATAPNASAINAVLQLTTRASVITTLIQAGDTVYLWDGATGFTSKATVNASSYLRGSYWSLGDYLVITDINLTNVVTKWDGTTYSNLTHTGISGSLYAKFAVVHLNRVWLFNIKIDSTEYPHMILACKFEDPTNWDNSLRGGDTTVGGGSFSTGLEAFYLLTPDLKPINGVTFFQNTLVMSTTNGHIFQLTGTSGKDFRFVDFFDTEPAIGVGQFASIGNDIVYLSRGGSIGLLFSTQNFGNVNLGDLSMWLPETTRNLAVIKAIVYDIENQRVYFFITDKVLVLFKDILNRDRYQVRSGVSPWSVYITDDDKHFNTNHAAYIVDPGTTSYNTFFGDEAGRIFALNGSGNQDAGASPVLVSRRSRHIGADIIQPWPWSEENLTGHLRYRRNTPLSLTVSVDWDDEYSTADSVVALKGPAGSDDAIYFNGTGAHAAYYGGPYYYNQGFTGTSRVSSININPGGKGPGFYLTISTPTNVPFQVDALEFD